MDFVFLISVVFAGLIDVAMIISFIAGMMKTENTQSKVADMVVILAMIVNVICVYLSFKGVK